MKRLIRWLVRGVAAVALLVAIAVATIYVLSERAMRRTYPVPRVALQVPTDADSIREGERLARILGCTHGCHGRAGEGGVMFDEPAIARIVAPNLTAAARRYSDDQLAAIIRHGLRPDGHSVIVMPAQAFAALNDADLARTIAFIRTLPPVDGPDASVAVGPLGRLGIALGQLHTVREEIESTVPPPPASDAQAELGRYWARSVCAECHGTGLRGASNPDFTSPNLRIVLAYSPEAFATLMRTGTALGGRELRVMSPTARQRFANFRDDEVAALYAYLHTVVP